MSEEDSGSISLEELKKANKEGVDLLAPDLETDDNNDEIDDLEAELKLAEEADANDLENDKDENAWLKGDEEDVINTDEDDEKKPFDNSTAGQIRRKYKAKADKVSAEKDETISQLEKRIENMEKNGSKPTPAQVSNKPERAKFRSDFEYIEALTDYKMDLRENERTSKTIAEQNKEQTDAATKKTNDAVDSHYQRAAALSEKSGIKPEAYQASDQRVREAVENLFPGGGDSVVDALINNLGEGSEKVFYHLGVNKAKLQDFVESFSEGQGLKTAAMLGELKARLVIPDKRISRAPSPGEEIISNGSGNQKETAHKKIYNAAHKKGDIQKAYDAKKAARSAGIDTKKW
jgi:hypothetical protein